METILKAENITKSYEEEGKKNLVLDHISLEIKKGEFVTVMGPSGSGKSTLLYCVSGMDTIDSGTITLKDAVISNYTEPEMAAIRRKEMGFVFQQPSLLKNLSILDNVILTAILDNPKDTEKITARGRALLKQTGISDLADRDIAKVSGGQLQRAGICRALINTPSILFADEPTGALNSKSAAEILQILKTINAQGTTILLVTHDAKVASESSRVLFMKDGRFVSDRSFSHTDSHDSRLDTITRIMRTLGI
ncbi:MAG: ABC transporter ATP-binding protein [Lachnospiraceae bacterium]|nr:ABC transporter ATP-binding protein [Lachnospiraceae bacterium]